MPYLSGFILIHTSALCHKTERDRLIFLPELLAELLAELIAEPLDEIRHKLPLNLTSANRFREFIKVIKPLFDRQQQHIARYILLHFF